MNFEEKILFYLKNNNHLGENTINKTIIHNDNYIHTHFLQINPKMLNSLNLEMYLGDSTVHFKEIIKHDC